MEREGYVYLDVRTVQEFEQGHPRGAYNVPWLEPAAEGLAPNPQFLAQVRAVLASDRAIVVGCASGVRSLAAAEALEAHGFRQVSEQRAGMSGVRDPFGRLQERGWRDESLPLSTQAEAGRSQREIAALAARATDETS
ncbi:MAG: Rhodanese domain protein [Myxococcaceae bacterium]|nr:Rhodanese domain protein [Myxococcaceae bacterium]